VENEKEKEKRKEKIAMWGQKGTSWINHAERSASAERDGMSAFHVASANRPARLLS
jgi:hypothetical protein